MGKKTGGNKNAHEPYVTVRGVISSVSYTATPVGGGGGMPPTSWSVTVTAVLIPAAGESVYSMTPFPSATGIDAMGHDISPPIALMLYSGNTFKGTGNLTVNPVHVRVDAKFLSAVVSLQG